MSSTNKTTYYELSQYVGTDKPTYLGDYNSDMLKIDTGLHAAADAADTAVTTANAANSAATSASTTASTALSTAQSASTTASQAQTTAETALTNSGAAQTAAEEAETAARANTITNLAPAYDSSLTYDVGELVTFIDAQGSGKMYKCIVAVTTPEAFNINKWDDVTTSDVFKTKDDKIITVFTATTNNTYADVLNGLATSISSISDLSKIGSLIVSRPDINEERIFNIDIRTSVNNKVLKWSNIDFLSTGNITIGCMAIRFSGTNQYIEGALYTNGSYTYTDKTNTNIPYDTTYTIISK